MMKTIRTSFIVFDAAAAQMKFIEVISIFASFETNHHDEIIISEYVPFSLASSGSIVGACKSLNVPFNLMAFVELLVHCVNISTVGTWYFGWLPYGHACRFEMLLSNFQRVLYDGQHFDSHETLQFC